VNCPTDTLLAACTNQTDIEAAYNNWINGFTHTGGCNATDNISEVPALTEMICGGSISFTYIVQSDCDTLECTKSFGVDDPPELTISCPVDTVLAACTTPADIQTAYDNWVAGFSYSGGCNAIDNINEVPALTEMICGGSISFTYIVQSDCDTLECTSSFGVDDPPELSISCPVDTVLAACTAPADIQTAYDNWVAGFSYFGGCNATDNINEVPTLTEMICGGSISFTYIVQSDCDTLECTSSFGVDDPPALSISCPADTVLAACTAPADIQTAYDNWVAGFSYSGGCNATDNKDEIPPLSDMICGGSISFTYIVESDCDTLECTRSFGVDDPPALSISCPTDTLLAACTNQTDLEAAYNNWINGFTHTGGCNKRL